MKLWDGQAPDLEGRSAGWEVGREFRLQSLFLLWETSVFVLIVTAHSMSCTYTVEGNLLYLRLTYCTD